MRDTRLLLPDEPFSALDALARTMMHALLRQLVDAHHPTVLLITRDVDEAILLADRAVAMRSRRRAAEHRVDFDGGRSRRIPAFDDLRHRLLAQLGVTELGETWSTPTCSLSGGGRRDETALPRRPGRRLRRTGGQRLLRHQRRRDDRRSHALVRAAGGPPAGCR
ncbi:hypothetical protein [Amycolatopsis sp. PS_44_ISF1]|uniref:hypothetical protein n=1 Tax=Amycolatopsis sp. PS_44_ISF1 TaxID=2974917 RepID=UPI0028DEAC4B|nr:hypothetical protein [Amycolatopsis sp. PS_44_ISF1]MDT8913679.1 hypothetical protein [Amycolatopsis sp. PS_44_ISF1]